MDSRYEKLKSLLDEQDYPSVYYFKAITKRNDERIVRIKRCFSEIAVVELHESRKGNYVSVCVKEMMLTSEDIIAGYESLGQMEGVIVL